MAVPGRWLTRIMSTASCRGLLPHMTILYLVTFLLVLPLACRNLRHSEFYRLLHNAKEDKMVLQQANDMRAAKARQFLASTNRRNVTYSKTQRPDVAITVVTVSRNWHNHQPSYLTQVTASFLQQLDSGMEHLTYSLSVCNVDANPRAHIEARDIAEYLPLYSRFNVSTGVTVARKEKEKQDYVFCLRQSLSENPRYVFMVEDDALPHSDWLQALDYVLKRHLDSSYRRGLFWPPKPTAYVKFFHPEAFHSFFTLFPEPQRILEWLSLTAVISSCLVTFYKSRLSYGVKLWLALGLYSWLVCLVIGRNNFITLRRLLVPYLYSYTPDPGCCMPATLYPADSARDIADYMDNVTCSNKYPKDFALDTYLVDTGSSGFLVQPNVFSHIGLYSATNRNIKPAYMISQ